MSGLKSALGVNDRATEIRRTENEIHDKYMPLIQDVNSKMKVASKATYAALVEAYEKGGRKKLPDDQRPRINSSAFSEMVGLVKKRQELWAAYAQGLNKLVDGKFRTSKTDPRTPSAWATVADPIGDTIRSVKLFGTSQDADRVASALKAYEL